MSRADGVRTLTIFLLKADVTEDNALDEESAGYRRNFTVTVGGKNRGTLHTKQTPVQPPGWVKFFADSLDPKAGNFRSASVSAVFLTRARGRLFALAFGHGRHFLRPGVFEERFGLRVTLNSVDPRLLRAVDVTTLETNPFHGKRQASREAPLGDFGVNLDQDILRAVTGRPTDDRLGTQMTGIDSLTVRVRVDLGGLQTLLGRYLEKSEDRAYRRSFPWVDHVAEVRDSALEQRLFDRLIEVINGDQSGSVWAAIPEAIDWTVFDSFRFGSPHSPLGYGDITIERMRDSLNGSAMSLDLLTRKRIYCMIEGNPHPLRAWPFVQCLTAEISLDGAMLLLNAGTWYRVDTDFVAQVNAGVNAIPSSDVVLPTWGDEHESAYNARVAKQSYAQIVLMDCVMILHPGMPSPIEFCDLFTTDRRIIHVKRYGQSSVLSHLFMQGLVSANCLLTDEKFRRAVNEKLPASHVLGDPDVRPSPELFEVAFAIGSSEVGALTLPFFSRVTLRNVFRTLTQSFGFRVTLTKVRIDRLIET